MDSDDNRSQQNANGKGPVGQGNYVMKQGECVESVAFQHGLFWQTVWNHPNNKQLQTVRKNPNVLLPGDKVFIPEKKLKEESGATEKRHCFRRKGVPARFTLILQDLGQPRANERYVLLIGGISREGKTDSEGELSEPIPPGAREGRLFLGDDQEEIVINFGNIDPIEEVSGVQTRLRNIGFYQGEIDGKLTPECVAAIAEFQRSAKLPGEGELNDDTRQALVKAIGS